MITSTIVVTPPAGSGNGATPPLVGPTGPSAYQVWVTAGHTGTPDDFLKSLIGPGSTAAQVQAATQALLGTPSGIAPLDAGSRVPPANYAVHPGQVLDAAAVAFTGIAGASLATFLATVTDPSTGDGSYTAVYVYPVAPSGGRLWTLLSTYLQAPPVSLTAAQTKAALDTIWQAAATIVP